MQMTRRSFIATIAAFLAALRLPSWLQRKPKPTYLFGQDAVFVQNLNAGRQIPFRTYLVGPEAVEHSPVSYSVTLAFGPPPDQTMRIRVRPPDAVS